MHRFGTPSTTVYNDGQLLSQLRTTQVTPYLQLPTYSLPTCPSLCSNMRSLLACWTLAVLPLPSLAQANAGDSGTFTITASAPGTVIDGLPIRTDDFAWLGGTATLFQFQTPTDQAPVNLNQPANSTFLVALVSLILHRHFANQGVDGSDLTQTKPQATFLVGYTDEVGTLPVTKAQYAPDVSINYSLGNLLQGTGTGTNTSLLIVDPATPATGYVACPVGNVYQVAVNYTKGYVFFTNSHLDCLPFLPVIHPST